MIDGKKTRKVAKEMTRGTFTFSFSRIADAMRVARRAFGKYKKQIIILTLLGFLGGLLEAVGVNALIPLFSFFVDSKDATYASIGFVATAIQKSFALVHLPYNLPLLLVLICILFIGKAIVTLYFNYLRLNIRSEYERETMDTLYSETLSADWPYLSKQKVGHLETVILTDVRQSGALLENIARAIGVLSSFIMYLFIALNISRAVTVMTLVLGIVIFFVFKPLLYNLRKYSKQTELLNKDVSHHVNESISGMKVIKAMGNENAFIRISSNYFESLKKLQVKSSMVQALTVAFIQPVSVIFVSVVVAFAYYNTSYNIGALAAIIYLIQQMFSNVQSIQSFVQMIGAAVPYVQGVLEYQEEAAKFAEHPKHQKEGKEFSYKNDLSFNDISFAYRGGEDHVLSSVSFDAKRGEMIGLIGKSGAGKTTLFDLLLRLLVPTSGKILVDGTDVQDISLEHWRENIAYVPQDAFLMNDTIYNNISFYNKNITKEDVEEAGKLAHLDEFVSQLPEGYKTIVGERGVRLSGGQRQRIAIARALVRKPAILLLDEATSALDVESEAHVQQAIKDLKGKMTIFIIAHRLSTVAHSDKLIVLEEGKIMETGSPQDLLKDKETYYARVYNIHS